MKLETALKSLNHQDRQVRLESIQRISSGIRNDELLPVKRKNECNNHVHSQYSFSPYSPSMIAWKAYRSGLSTCGIIDHESVAGCREFQEACRILGIVPTIGFEIRLNWNHTPLKDKMFNDPDQKSVGYFPIHGVPVSKLAEIERFLQPIRQERYRRNQKMVKNIDSILRNYGLGLDFDWDVIPVSKWSERGSITERHLLYATAKKLANAQDRALADGYTLVLYEGFRPYETQIAVAQSLSALAETEETVRSGITSEPWSINWFIATGVSTHQQGCAVDVSLARVTAAEQETCGPYVYTRVTGCEELEMPTAMHELSSAAASLTQPVASTNLTAWQEVLPAPAMTEAALALRGYCTAAGLTPLASEWWHFNDLDRLVVADESWRGEFTLAENLSEAIAVSE